MSYRGGYTLGACVVECHHATVAERELYLTLALLAGYLAGHGTVHLVGEPVLRCHSLKRECVGYIFLDILFVVGHILVGGLYSAVGESRFGRRAEHVAHCQVYGLNAVLLLEYEAVVACGLAHHIHRGAFALCDGPHIVEILLFQHHAHALLALVAYYLF